MKRGPVRLYGTARVNSCAERASPRTEGRPRLLAGGPRLLAGRALPTCGHGRQKELWEAGTNTIESSLGIGVRGCQRGNVSGPGGAAVVWRTGPMPGHSQVRSYGSRASPRAEWRHPLDRDTTHGSVPAGAEERNGRWGVQLLNRNVLAVDLGVGVKAVPAEPVGVAAGKTGQALGVVGGVDQGVFFQTPPVTRLVKQ